MKRYDQVKKLLERESIGWKKYRKKYPQRNWINAELKKEFNIPEITNNQKSFFEVQSFLKKKPKIYSAYVTKDKQIGTWVGDKLGDVIWEGQEFHGGFGSKRKNFRIKAITGDIYSGTHYKSSGDYVRLKKLKTKIKRMKGGFN